MKCKKCGAEREKRKPCPNCGANPKGTVMIILGLVLMAAGIFAMGWSFRTYRYDLSLWVGGYEYILPLSSHEKTVMGILAGGGALLLLGVILLIILGIRMILLARRSDADRESGVQPYPSSGGPEWGDNGTMIDEDDGGDPWSSEGSLSDGMGSEWPEVPSQDSLQPLEKQPSQDSLQPLEKQPSQDSLQPLEKQPSQDSLQPPEKQPSQDSLQPLENQLPKSDSWTCSACGRTGNTGKYCPKCGAQRPAAAAPASVPASSSGVWTCRCGNVGNTGKYCDRCGVSRDEGQIL